MQRNCQNRKPQFLVILAKFTKNLGQFWPKWAIFEIAQKKRKCFFFDSRENASSKEKGQNRKPQFFGRFGQIQAKFGSILAKMGHF